MRGASRAPASTCSTSPASCALARRPGGRPASCWPARVTRPSPARDPQRGRRPAQPRGAAPPSPAAATTGSCAAPSRCSRRAGITVVGVHERRARTCWPGGAARPPRAPMRRRIALDRAPAARCSPPCRPSTSAKRRRRGRCAPSRWRARRAPTACSPAPGQLAPAPLRARHGRRPARPRQARQGRPGPARRPAGDRAPHGREGRGGRAAPASRSRPG